MRIRGDLCASTGITTVFFKLMVMTKSVQALAKQSQGFGSASRSERLERRRRTAVHEAVRAWSWFQRTTGKG